MLWQFFINTVTWLSCFNHFISRQWRDYPFLSKRDYHVFTPFHQNNVVPIRGVTIIVWQFFIKKWSYYHVLTICHENNDVSDVFITFHQNSEVTIMFWSFFIKKSCVTSIFENFSTKQWYEYHVLTTFHQHSDVTILFWSFFVKAATRLSCFDHFFIKAVTWLSCFDNVSSTYWHVYHVLTTFHKKSDYHDLTSFHQKSDETIMFWLFFISQSDVTIIFIAFHQNSDVTIMFKQFFTKTWCVDRGSTYSSKKWRD